MVVLFANCPWRWQDAVIEVGLCGLNRALSWAIKYSVLADMACQYCHLYAKNLLVWSTYTQSVVLQNHTPIKARTGVVCSLNRGSPVKRTADEEDGVSR